MKRVLIIVGVLLAHLAGAQNYARIDSLKKRLSTAEGEHRYTTLNDLAWEYRFAYPDSTVYFGKQAFSVAEKLHLGSNVARSLNVQGVALNYKGDRLAAYDLFLHALNVSESQFDTLQIAHSNNNLGRLFFEQGVLAKAYDHFIKAHDLFKKKKDAYGLAYSLQSLGTLQRSQKDFSQAEKFYLDAYAIRLRLGNRRDIMAGLMLLSRLYYEEKKFTDATRVLRQADSVGNLIHDNINLAEAKVLLAKSLMGEGKVAEAEIPAKEGYAVIARMDYKRMMSEALLTLGIIQKKQGHLAEAGSMFRQSLAAAQQTRDLQNQMDAHHELWKLAELQNNKTDVIYFMNQYLVLNDSIKDLELTRQIERLKFQLDIEKRDRENNDLKLAQLQQQTVIAEQRGLNIALLIGVIGSVLVLGILWYFYKRRTSIFRRLQIQNKYIDLQRQQIEKRNNDLLEQNVKLEELNHEKDMLMNIVAHDLKSPLTRIVGLSNLIESEGNLSNAQREYIRLMKDVTQSNLDLITDLLDVNALEHDRQVPSPVDFDVATLLHERMTFFQFAAIGKKIDLKFQHSLQHHAHGNPAYLGRIIDNLVSNAIKFCRPGATVSVSAAQEDGTFVLRVQDDGPGFSEADKALLFQRFKKLSARPTAGETSNGLGLAIVKTLVDRLSGEIDLTSERGKGSQFIIRIPLRVVERIAAN